MCQTVSRFQDTGNKHWKFRTGENRLWHQDGTIQIAISVRLSEEVAITSRQNGVTRSFTIKDAEGYAWLLVSLWRPSRGFWDVGTTTPSPKREDTVPRTSYFRWQRTEFTTIAFWFPHFDWHDIANRRALCVVAGISLDHTPLGTAAILNRRQLLTSGNYLDKVMDRQRSLRIWCLGRAGRHDTPFRYRVWRVHRIPRSNNPEHRHGARGYHCPRHDVAVIISHDQMYIYSYYPHRYQYAYQTWLTTARTRLPDYVIMTGSGYEYLQHIYENYKIFYTKLPKWKIVDCSKYLPKWWGKFICVRNDNFLSGVQNGGPVLGVKGNILFALGCFEIRYNEDRIFVLTDLRYYTRWIYKYARMNGGDYYEFAYPEWGMQGGTFDWYDGHSNNPKIPHFHVHYDLFPLG